MKTHSEIGSDVPRVHNGADEVLCESLLQF